jgi:NADH-ubiquinone oxidoreductase chain 3
MFYGLTLFIISFFIILLVFIISKLLAEQLPLNREELSPYECGFEHHNVSRIPFSLRYFFLTLIFLLFDLEIILLLFVPSFVFSVSYYFAVLFLISFIFILFLSLIYE